MGFAPMRTYILGLSKKQSIFEVGLTSAKILLYRQKIILD